MRKFKQPALTDDEKEALLQKFIEHMDRIDTLPGLKYQDTLLMDRVTLNLLKELASIVQAVMEAKVIDFGGGTTIFKRPAGYIITKDDWTKDGRFNPILTTVGTLEEALQWRK